MDNYEVMNLLSKLSKEDDNSNTRTIVAIGVMVLAGVAYYQFRRNATTSKLMYGLREKHDDLMIKYDCLVLENQMLQQNQKNLEQTISFLGREKQVLLDKLKRQESGDSAVKK